MVAGDGGKMGVRDSQGVWDGHVHATAGKMDNRQRPTAQHREPCSALCGSLDRREVWGRTVHVYVWLSSFAVHLKLSQDCLLTGYTPVQSKKLKREHFSPREMGTPVRDVQTQKRQKDTLSLILKSGNNNCFSKKNNYYYSYILICSVVGSGFLFLFSLLLQLLILLFYYYHYYYH